MPNQDSIQKIQEVNRVLEKTDSNVVREILRQSKAFIQWDHYPEDDVFDKQTHAQYYYHSHPRSVKKNNWEEHGHFHLFLRKEGMPAGCKPTKMPKHWRSKKSDTICHLIAISMDAYGRPIKLFTANRWVTNETWYGADDVCNMLDAFVIDHAFPSWPVNIWLTEMVKLYKDEIKTLIYKRDKRVSEWKRLNPGVNIFADEKLEITSAMDL